MTYLPWSQDILAMTKQLSMQRLWELFHYTDGKLYRKAPVRGAKRGSLLNCKTQDNYLEAGVDGKNIRVHRIIYFMFYGYLPRVVDHINGNTLDNRIENLRAATHSQNSWNAKISKRNKSGVKGVSWHKTASKWVAHIGIKRKLVYLGLHESLQQAEQAVKQARLNLHGEFARHN